MSVASLIARMGRSVAVRRPTTDHREDGSFFRTEEQVLEARAFIQPRAASETDAQGRQQMRQSCVLYLEGSVDIRTDDIVCDPPTGTDCRIYRVTGVRLPDEASDHPNAHTIVDATRIEPTEARWNG
jgi:hypothetical protein